MDIVDLGTGALYWHADERRTDRYGTVHLNKTPEGDTPDPITFGNAPIGTHGRLVAVILDTRPAFHLGDWTQGHTPSTPATGDEITLGTGTLFVEPSRYGNTEIGLRPDDDRDTNWLNPAALYRCHEQTVRLELRPSHKHT
ncbi:hypothetical protein ACWEV3_40225 [Saccharopolyspora sp. NPDC003752]